MNLRQIAGKLLRSIPYLIYQSFRLMARKIPGGAAPSSDSTKNVRKVLIICLDAIGDFLMATPALRSLQKHFPAAQMDIIVQPGVAAVAKDFPGVQNLQTLRCQFLIRGGGRLSGIAEWISKLLALRRRKYDLIVDFSGLFHSAFTARLIGAPLRIGPRREIPLGFFKVTGWGHFYTHEVELGEEEHHADKINKLATALGAEADSGGWGSGLTEKKGLGAEETRLPDGIPPGDKFWVLIHPGAKWPPRQWSPKNFSEVIDILTERGLLPIVTAGPGEEALMNAIRQHAKSSPTILWPPTSLDTFWGFLRMADTFLGNDSGPMHLAAAAGTPIVSIFGPNSPERVGPRGSPFIPFYSALECSPCRQYFERDKCHRGHNYCMDEYDPHEVAAAVVKLAQISDTPRRLRRSSLPESQS